MDRVIELQLQPNNMNRTDGLILSRSCKPLFTASSDSTVEQSSRWMTCSWSLPEQLPSPLSQNLPDSLLDTARCPPSLTTPFGPLLTCSLSSLSKGLHVQGGEVVVTRLLQVEQEAPGLHGNQWCWPQHALSMAVEMSPCVPVTPFSTPWSPQLLPH